MNRAVTITVTDMLDYFGKCPRCGYPATASKTVRHLGRINVVIEVVATCGLPCGWSGQVPETTMTGQPSVGGHGHTASP
ncbi:hypothetical protein [Nocardia callitridis]|uniref:Transposase n=1 Tax=Nocardia callitridis TaxID=648753 RepID=A0ABP9KAM0_9NOCA